MYLIVFSFFFILYVIPYSVIAAMPGWRSLAVATVVVGILLAWGILDIEAQMRADNSPGGFGVAIARGAAYLGVAGTISAAISRSITFLLRRTRWSRFSAVVILVGLFVPPTVWFGYVHWQERQRRPPSEAYISQPIRISLAGDSYDLPRSKFFTI